MDQIIDVWGAWFSGTPVGSHDLWGITVTGWGRLGKIMQFAAALVIVAEIAGPERLRRFGESLRMVSAKADAKATLFGAFGWFWLWVKNLADAGGPEDAEIMVRKRQTYASIGAAAFLWGLVFLPWFFRLRPVEVDLRVLEEYVDWAAIQEELSWVPDLGVLEVPTIAIGVPTGLVAAWLSLYIVAPVVTTLIWTALASLTFLARRLALATASVLERPTNERALKIGSVFLLALGFHFDLLAS